MSISALTGPVVAFGQADQYDYNPEIGPSLFVYGAGILDPRTQFNYNPGQDFGSVTAGFLGFSDIITVNQVPSTISAVNIVAAAAATAGTPLTLVSATGAGITAGASVVNANTGVLVTGLLAIDGAAGRVSFGSAGTIQLWDPTKAISRALRITSAGNDSGGTFLVSGYDIYGFPMSQLVTGANAGIATTTKAFKYIASILPAGTISGSNVSVGTADVYGFPIYSQAFIPGVTADVAISWNGAGITATTGYTAGDTTTPATTSTGDVRGTYAVQSASDGTKRLVMMQSPSLANIGSVTGTFGQPQV